MRKILLINFFVNTLTMYGQVVDLNKRITLEVDNIPLEKLFEILEEQHGMRIAFGLDNIPSALKVTIAATNKKLHEILNLICIQSNLSYQIIDNAIVFKYTRPKIFSTTKSLTDSDSIHAFQKQSVQNSILSDSISTHIPSTDQVLDSADTSEVSGAIKTELMKLQPVVQTPSYLEPITLPSLFSPSKKASKIPFYRAGVFYSYALDFNRFQFMERDIAFQKYNTEWNYSFSAGGYVIVSSKIYISLGTGYATKDFVLNYNYEVLDPDDPFPIPNQTQVKVRYIEIPLTIGYSIYTHGKYSICIAAGFYPSYLVDKRESTSYLNQGKPDTEYFVKANRSILYGGTVGFIFHYALSKNFGVFLEPDYLYYIGTVNKEAMHSNSAMFRIKTGIQFSLYSRK